MQDIIYIYIYIYIIYLFIFYIFSILFIDWLIFLNITRDILSSAYDIITINIFFQITSVDV